MRQRRAQQARVQQARQSDIGGEAYGTGHFLFAVPARRRLADLTKVGIGRQRRRLLGGNHALDLRQRRADDAERQRFTP